MAARIYADAPNALHGVAGESVRGHPVELEGKQRVRRTEVSGQECYELLG